MSLNPFDTSGFPPRWYCGPAWSEEPLWGWIHVVSDVVIWLSYISIPAAALFALRKRGDVPLRGIVALFAAFVIACGFTHLIEAMIFWWPIYRLSALMKLATAIISAATVLVLIKTIPQIISLRSPAQLEDELDIHTGRLDQLNTLLGVDPDDLDGVERFAFERTQLRLALEGGKMGAWFWDFETQKVTSSEEQASLIGLTDEELESVDAFMNRVHSEDRGDVERSLQEAIAGDGIYDQRFRFRHGNGKEMWLGGRGQVLKDASGKPRALVGVNWDTTADQELQEELERQRLLADSANAAKGDFLANVSHEIRTPLTAILGCADVLFPMVDEGRPVELLNTIRRQGELLHRLLNDVLDLSKVEAGQLEIQPESCDVRQIVGDIRSLLNPMAAEKGIELQANVGPRVPPMIKADPLRVRQVLLNLATNAIKFTEAGSVSVAAEAAVEDGELIGLTMIVEDTGPGIPPDQISRVFAPFEQLDGSNTRQVGGTGLGLSISDHLVELMGGSMDVESTVGQGTRFAMRIPVEEVETQTLKPVEKDVAPITQPLPLKVLVAEDTDVLQFVIKSTLTPVVDELVLVDNGKLAVEAVVDASMKNSPFDAVLMDIQMPVMDGLDATRKLRADGYDLPIYALTAAAMTADMQKSVAAGCTGHLSKPIDVAAVTEALKSCVR